MADATASPLSNAVDGTPAPVALPPSAEPRAAEEALPTAAPVVHTLKRPRAGEPVTHFLQPSSCGTPAPATTEQCGADTTQTEEGRREGRGEVREAVTAVPPKQVRLEASTPSSTPVTPRSPYANLPRKIPRKTPVSTPTSSLVSPSLVSPAAAASPLSTPPQASATAVSPAASRLAALHQRWATMLHGVLIKERAAHEADAVMALALRIVDALPGDAEQRKDGFQTILLNMKDAKNGELRRRVVEGELLVERLVRMDDRELANPELRQQIEQKMEDRAKDTNLSELAKAMRTSNSTLFKCKACGARDTSWYQRQTRSGDEPMTVIITCNRCGVQWRQY